MICRANDAVEIVGINRLVLNFMQNNTGELRKKSIPALFQFLKIAIKMLGCFSHLSEVCSILITAIFS